jgi:patatin-like phospholipase/acyl hydrolase
VAAVEGGVRAARTQRAKEGGMADRKCVLAVDGGGIRGVVPAIVMAAIEERTGRRIGELFDLIAGTSTGGILALGSAVPDEHGKPAFAATDLLSLYVDHGQEIFPQHHIWRDPLAWRGVARPKYDPGPLERLLRERFGDTMMSQGVTELAITSYDMYRSQPFFFKRSYARDNAAWDCEMWKAARSTSAAPTYFPPFQLEPFSVTDTMHVLVDGGVFVNNPTVCGYVEALDLWAVAQPDTEIVVCSIGTGSKRMRQHDDIERWGALEWAPAILDTVFDGVADAVDYQMTRLCRHEDDIERYFRFQTDVPQGTSAAMDDASPEHVEQLKLLASELVERDEERLGRLCGMLGDRAPTPT